MRSDSRAGPGAVREGLVVLVASVDVITAVAAIIAAGATATYTFFTYRILQRTITQAQAARDQVDLLQRQLDQQAESSSAEKRALDRQLALGAAERAQREREAEQRAQEAADAQRLALRSYRDNLRARFDLAAPNVLITAARPDITLTAATRQSTHAELPLPDRVENADLAEWIFRLTIPFDITNFGDSPALVDVPSPPLQEFVELEKADSRSLVVGPGSTWRLTWQHQGYGEAWWASTEKGWGFEGTDNVWGLEFVFTVIEPVGRVFETHRWWGQVQPFEIDGSFLVPKKRYAVNANSAARIEREYPSLDGATAAD